MALRNLCINMRKETRFLSRALPKTQLQMDQILQHNKIWHSNVLGEYFRGSLNTQRWVKILVTQKNNTNNWQMESHKMKKAIQQRMHLRKKVDPRRGEGTLPAIHPTEYEWWENQHSTTTTKIRHQANKQPNQWPTESLKRQKMDGWEPLLREFQTSSAKHLKIYHLIPVRIAVVNNISNNISWCRCGEGEGLSTAGGRMNWCSHCGRQSGSSSKKLKIKLLYSPAIPTPGHRPSNYIYKNQFLVINYNHLKCLSVQLTLKNT